MYLLYKDGRQRPTTESRLQGSLHGRLQSIQNDSFIDIEILKAYTASRESGQRKFKIILFI